MTNPGMDAVFQSLAALAGLAIPAVAGAISATRFRKWTIDMSDPYEPDAAALADAIRAIAAEMDAHPRPAKICIKATAEPGRVFTIDADAGGARFKVSDSSAPDRDAVADVRRRWICEHPLPLAIRPGTRTVLYAVPVDANRFRVSPSPPAVRRGAGAVLSGAIAAAAGIFLDSSPLAALGAALSVSAVLCASAPAARFFAAVKSGG